MALYKCSIIIIIIIIITVAALYLGIKMFIIEYLYNRFPRFKQHRDSVYRTWCQLPTDAALEDQYKRSLVDQVCFILFLLTQSQAVDFICQ